MKLKVLELFAGTRSVSKAFEANGHETFSIEWDKSHPDIDWYVDLNEVTAKDILERFGQPDVIWSSNDCTTFSVAGIGIHRTKNLGTGNLDPKTEKAEKADKLNNHVFNLIRELKPALYFIENPRGGLRKMNYIQDFPRYTLTYCQYGFPYMKPTDIWTNHPDPQFKPPCKNGAPCHEKAPRGSRTGLQGIQGSKCRSVIPPKLCEHIVAISEEYFSSTEVKND